MKPLIVLLAAFGLSVLATVIFGAGADFSLSGRIAMSVMLLFTAMGHFKFTKGMTMMLPGFIPLKTVIVYLTGLIEIAAAIGLFIPSLRTITGWLLIVFFILILPANIHALLKKVDYEKGALTGKGLNYLWFRVPLQIFFIGWVYFFIIQMV